MFGLGHACIAELKLVSIEFLCTDFVSYPYRILPFLNSHFHAICFVSSVDSFTQITVSLAAVFVIFTADSEESDWS